MPDFTCFQKSIKFINIDLEEPFSLELLRIAARGDRQVLLRLVSNFSKSIHQNTFLLEEYLHQKDWKAIKSCAHKLKACIETLQIKGLYNMIREIEQQSEADEEIDQAVIHHIVSELSSINLLLKDRYKLNHPLDKDL